MISPKKTQPTYKLADMTTDADADADMQPIQHVPHVLHAPQSLLYAIMSGNVQQVQELVNCGIHISSCDSWIIYEACLQGPDMIQALASDPNIDLNPIIPGQRHDRVFHHLLRTRPTDFQHDKYETIKSVLRIGIDPYLPDSCGNTAIHILAGAATDTDQLGLFELIVCGKLPVGETETRNGVCILDMTNMAERNTALIIAVQRNNIHHVRLLLEHGANLHIRGEFNRTALFYAVARNFVRVAELLLSHGAMIENDIVPLSLDMVKVLSRSQLLRRPSQV